MSSPAKAAISSSGIKVKSKSSAAAALQAAQDLKAQAEALMEEHGITAMLEGADALKKQATKFCAEKGIDRLDLEDGSYGKLITSVQERVWVGTKDDIPGDAVGRVTPLKSLVSKEIWMKLTRRVPDPEKINDAVAEGLVTLKEIEPCYFEKHRSPYLRVFAGSADEKD